MNFYCLSAGMDAARPWTLAQVPSMDLKPLNSSGRGVARLCHRHNSHPQTTALYTAGATIAVPVL